MSKSQKILFVVTEDWYFCSHRLPLAIALVKQGYNVSVLTRTNEYKELISSHGIQVISWENISRLGMNVFSEIKTFLELFGVLKSEKPDLVHLVAVKPAVYGGLAAYFLNIPARVFALGGLGFIFSSRKKLAKVLRPVILILFRLIFNQKNSRLILQNEDDINLLQNKAKVNLGQIRLIRGAGVDLEQYTYQPLPEGIPVVMLAARMIWDKGIGDFVQAAKIIQQKNIKARFVLVGDPDDQNPNGISRAQLEQWHQSGVVEYWGHQKDMPKILSQAHILCLPSYYGEGLPKVLIEAMACGRAIITTNMPGCYQLIQKDPENGILISPQKPDELASAILLLLANPERCTLMGKNGRELVHQKFALNIIIRQTQEVYNELLRAN